MSIVSQPECQCMHRSVTSLATVTRVCFEWNCQKVEDKGRLESEEHQFQCTDNIACRHLKVSQNIIMFEINSFITKQMFFKGKMLPLVTPGYTHIHIHIHTQWKNLHMKLQRSSFVQSFSEIFGILHYFFGVFFIKRNVADSCDSNI